MDCCGSSPSELIILRAETNMLQLKLDTWKCRDLSWFVDDKKHVDTDTFVDLGISKHTSVIIKNTARYPNCIHYTTLSLLPSSWRASSPGHSFARFCSSPGIRSFARSDLLRWPSGVFSSLSWLSRVWRHLSTSCDCMCSLGSCMAKAIQGVSQLIQGEICILL